MSNIKLFSKHFTRLFRLFLLFLLFLFIVKVEVPFLYFICNQWIFASGYILIGLIAASICLPMLAKHFQYRDYLFYSKREERIQHSATSNPQFAQFLDDIGHRQFKDLMLPSRSKVELGNWVRALLWSVTLIPVWPILIIWRFKIRDQYL